MIYIGIDPGKKGAMAVIDSETIDLPVVIKFSPEAYRSILLHARGMKCTLGKEVKCCLEHVGAMPGQGVTSMFHFGENFGYIRGLLEAFEIPYELVRPQKWKKEFSITGEKNSSIEVCKRLFPGVDLRRSERCRKDDDGLAESLLMAEYARRRL